MRQEKMRSMWLSGLIVTLFCLCSFTAFAGVAKPVPTGPMDPATGLPAVPDYFTTANWANSPPLTKFVDKLPGLGKANANARGQYLPVATPDITTYPGSDYYEIELVEYNEQMHSDLPAPGTLLRGYRQTNRGTDTSVCGGAAPQLPCSSANLTVVPESVPHYLGPVIVSTRNRPVRIKFTNSLPTGAAGDLFIPVDTTYMGAGAGPALGNGIRGQGTACSNDVLPTPGNPNPNNCSNYTQNRATLHLHGGRTPWISDGTPHQWITPAAENTPYPQGVSVQNVPDMPDPGDGSQTFFYSNQQSARLMFYHDHAFGITRLNVYVGEAAGYLITDPYEQDLVARGILPAEQIPLVIEDKTFVDAATVRTTDPLWNWGTGAIDVNGVRAPVTGDLWMSHVYMTNQNPYNPDKSGINPFGRWFYGPWFYPPTVITLGPVANPYFDIDCADPTAPAYATCTTPGQPPFIPGTPHNSPGMEAWQDTAIVNGTAFPVLEVDPKAYRFRILNAANDRGLNLSLYKADTALPAPADARRLDNATEVKMVPAAATAGWPALWPADARLGGVPDPGTCVNGTNCSNWGPSWIQIGTEGGFLPAPVVKNPQPVTYIVDPTAFWFGNVLDTSLGLMPAERADVVVDFSAFAGQTLILYNDAPTAWPALDPRYDYFSEAPDQRATGGYGTGGTYDAVTKTWTGGTGPLRGFGPNTRTVMQIKVRAGTPVPFNKAALDLEFTNSAPATALNPVLAAPASQAGKTLPLFKRAQEPIIALQAAYQNAYPDVIIPTAFPWWGVRSSMLQYDFSFLTTENRQVIQKLEPKAMHDEMGASFDVVYGRMQSNLGMEIPNPKTNNANMIIYGYQDIPSETIFNSATGPVQVNAAPLTTLADGTQIWNISHNGVDTHPIHFHIFDVQLINRIGWDGRIALPDPNELGWKDTVRISPLEDTIVALRPVAPLLPFGIPDSNRPLAPTLPIGSTMGFSLVNWINNGAFVPPVTNQLTSFGWEYVWHCHILSHEEMDMMRPIVLLVTTAVPPAPANLAVSTAAVLTWVDQTPAATAATLAYQQFNEIGFRIERCTAADCSFASPSWTQIGKALANATTYTDTTAVPGLTNYRVIAYNQSGPSVSVSASATIGAVTPPTVTIDAPLTGASAAFGAAIPVTVTATPGSSAIAKVDYYINGALYGSNAVGPFGISIVNASPGTLVITAKATDSAGAVSVVSNAVTVTVVQTAAPASITVPAGSATGSYTVSWGASATAGVTYVLEESSTANFAAPTPIAVGTGGTDLFALITGKADSTTYYYRVKAVSAGIGGSSVWTTGANGCVVSFPTVAPASITVPFTSGTGSYTVTWGASTTPGATYTLEESTVSNFASSTVVASGLAGLSQVISGKNNGTFYYRVKAVAAGFSTFPWRVGGNGCVVSLLPTVDAPLNGANVVLSVSIPFSATVPSITGLTFSRVDFFDNGVQVGTLAGAAPYSIPWVPGFIGSHNLSVIAYYSGGHSAMSNTVTVTVNAAAVPTITINALPAAIDLGTPTTVTATSVAPGYTLIGLYFSENGTFLSWANPGTTSITWTPATAGARTLTATAYYAGLAAPVTSAVVPVTINGTVIAPASITVPATSATGTYAVSWTAAVPATAGATFTLQESTDPLFGTFTETLNAGLSASYTGKANGTYYYRVQAVKPPMTPSAWVSGQIVVNRPIYAATLTAGVPSPQFKGASVTFTASALGGNGAPYEYEFWLHNLTTGVWTTEQAYSTLNTWTWNTSALSVGNYEMTVRVRNQGQTAFFQVTPSVPYTINLPAPTSGTLSSNVPSPQFKGTTINFVSTALGGTGTPYEYEFWLHNLTTGTWTIEQAYSISNSFAWNTATAAAGNYELTVRIRNQGQTAYFEVAPKVPYTLTIGVPTSGTLSAGTPSSPQMVGTTINFTATALGGSATPYEYEFWLYNLTTGVWSIAQNYSVSNSFAWNTATAAAGNYELTVRIRNQGQTAFFQVSPNVPYTLIALAPTSGTLSAGTPSSPQMVGTSINFTATALGGSGTPYEYEFWLHNLSTGVWTTVQAYSTLSTFAWNTATAAVGNYELTVRIRNQGQTAYFEVAPKVPYTLTVAAPTSGTLSVGTPSSPQAVGTAISFTATALGGSGTPYEYEFWLHNLSTGIWTVVQNYSTLATLSWNSSTATAGNYELTVRIRNQGQTAFFQVAPPVSYTLF